MFNRTRFTIRSSFVALASVATLIVLVAQPGAAGAPTTARGAGQLRDLQVATAQPTDHATAQVTATESGGETTVTLKVQGLDHAAAGDVLGAHVHIGPCTEGDGPAALGHYNTTGGTTKDEETEVWLDFTVAPNGTGWATTTVPFAIAAGDAKSVVIHEEFTKPITAAAGARWACLPVEF